MAARPAVFVMAGPGLARGRWRADETGLTGPADQHVPWRDIETLERMDSQTAGHLAAIGRGAAGGAAIGLVAAPFLAAVTVSGGLIIGAIAGGIRAAAVRERRMMRVRIVTSDGPAESLVSIASWRMILSWSGRRLLRLPSW